MSAVSDNLIHFLARASKDSPGKQLAVFKSIIETGLRTSQIQIKFGDGGSIFNEVVCFTDIPLAECDEHTAVYGKFGIGFKKSFVKVRGGNPARYFVDYAPGTAAGGGPLESRGLLSTQLSRLQNTVLELRKRLNDPQFALFDQSQNLVFNFDSVKAVEVALMYVLSFEKEMGDLGAARDDTTEVDLYYKEREWRLVPSNAAVASGLALKEQVDGHSRFHFLFDASAVNMVVVPNDETRAEVLRYLLGLLGSADPRLKGFAESPVPIITYDDLKRW
jgi:hypothetical protein